MAKRKRGGKRRNRKDWKKGLRAVNQYRKLVQGKPNLSLARYKKIVNTGAPILSER